MDLATIRHVATLAELSLGAEEEQKLGAEMTRILAYVAELDALDTTDVPPTTQAFAHTWTRPEDGWRVDALRPGLPHEAALAGAPEADHGGFVVPTFVE